MTKSATEVMHDIVYAAVIDAVAALKTASKGLPNTLLRDLNAIHANSTFADLPPELKAAIDESVRSAFTRLLKEGFAVAPRSAVQVRPSSPAGHRPRGNDGRPPVVRGGRPPRGNKSGDNKPGGGDGRPPRGGRPPRSPRPKGR